MAPLLGPLDHNMILIYRYLAALSGINNIINRLYIFPDDVRFLIVSFLKDLNFH